MNNFEDNLWGSVVDRYGDDLARADTLVATRRPGPRLLVGATAGVAASATAVGLLLSVVGSPPAFAVTLLHDGSVSVTINRTSPIAEVNAKLAAMGIHEIDKQGNDALSSIPSCSSIPPGWNGEWVQVSGAPTGGTGNSGITVWNNFAPGTWHLVICDAVDPGNTGSGNTASVNTGAD